MPQLMCATTFTPAFSGRARVTAAFEATGTGSTHYSSQSTAVYVTHNGSTTWGVSAFSKTKWNSKVQVHEVDVVSGLPFTCGIRGQLSGPASVFCRNVSIFVERLP